MWKISKLCKRSYSTNNLFTAISDLDVKYNIKLKSFPNLFVFGPQSTGKSSVIESICGERILPIAMKMSTLKPIHLTTIRSKDKKFKVGDRDFFSSHEAADEIHRMNNNSQIPKVNVTIWSPSVYNSYLVDLPGLFVVAPKDDENLHKRVKEISADYLQEPNNIPVIVHSAPQDPATNQALNMIKKYKRERDAMGIITKVDMLENQNMGFIDELLKGDNYQLGHGYCAVILRSDKDIEQGKTIDDKMSEEEEFFKKHHLKPSGVMEMRKMISNLQFNKIKDQIPNLITDIDQHISTLQYSHSFMNNLLENEQKKFIAKIEAIITKLVGSALERGEFENKLKSQIQQSLQPYLNIDELLSKKYTAVHSDKTVHKYIQYYNKSHQIDPNNFLNDNIKELFSTGLISPIFIDNQLLGKRYSNEMELAMSMHMIEPYINDPLGRKRSEWNRKLNTYFSKLLINDDIHRIIYEVTEKALLEYIYDDVEDYDEISKKFVEYMVKEIGIQAYESNIKNSITSILNLEKRPQISMFELGRYIAQMHPSFFTYKGGTFENIFHENKKLQVEIYGSEWSDAYLRVVNDNLANNIYRNIAVNLLDKMIGKIIELCMDLFNREQAVKEKNRINEKINALNKIRSIISTH